MRHLERTLAAALIGAALAGCGGSGEPRGESSADRAAAAAVAVPRHALAGVTRSRVSRPGTVTKTTATLYVFEPDAAATVSLKIDLGAVPDDASPVLWSRAYQVDRPKRSARYEGLPKAFFVKAGRVYQIDLRPGRSRRPVRLSSMTDACQVGAVLPMSPDGVDAWVKVTPELSPGRCPEYNPYPAYGHGVMLHTAMKAEDDRVNVSPELNDLLDDGMHRPGGWLIGKRMYDRDFERSRAVRGAAPFQSLALYAPDFANLGATYAMANDELRRVTWSSGSATLGPRLHTFVSQRWSGPAADRTGLFFPDRDTLYHTSGDSPSRALASTGSEEIGAVALAGKHVVLTLAGTTTSFAVVRRSGGAIRRLGTVAMLGVTDRAAVFTDRIEDLSSGTTTRFAASQWGSVHARTAVADQAYLDATLTCRPAGVQRCDELVQTDLATMKARAIGRFAPQGGLALTSRDPPDTTGVPALLTYWTLSTDADGTQRTAEDLYRWTPGKGGSLQRLTRNLE